MSGPTYDQWVHERIIAEAVTARNRNPAEYWEAVDLIAALEEALAR